MSRHDHDHRSPTSALERARLREHARRSHRADLAGAPPSLDVHVDDLADAALDIELALAADAVTELLDEGKEFEWTATSDASIKLRLEREAGLVHVRGLARFALKHPCVRCLNSVPFDVPLDVDLRLARVEAGAEGKLPEAEEGAGELDSDVLDGGEIEDIGVASYTGDVIHLAEVLREQLFLELPMHPACDSPRARPTEPCAFDAAGALKKEQERWVDPRWAGLQKLKEQLVASQKEATDVATAPATPVVPLPGRQTPVPLPGRASSPPSKPVAKMAKPVAKKAKPAAKQAKPAAKKAKPAAKQAKPAARKAKPAARKAKPAARKAKPAAKKANPAKKRR